jgi:hypothetical protein
VTISRHARTRVGDEQNRGRSSDIGLTALVAASVLLLSLVGYRWASKRQHGESGGDHPTSTSGVSGGDQPTSTDSVVPGGSFGGTKHVPDGAGEKRAAAGGDAHSNDHEVTTGDPGSQSDEERVLALVEDSGGRMRQARIVASTDWSESKMSTLLSEMHDAGSVRKIRLGRENLVCLAGEEPELVGSFADSEEEQQV